MSSFQAALRVIAFVSVGGLLGCESEDLPATGGPEEASSTFAPASASETLDTPGGEEYESAPTCTSILDLRSRGGSEGPANILAQGANPAHQELWKRLRNCANANRCEKWDFESLYTPQGCIARACKQQLDQCVYGVVPGTPAPPVNKTWTCNSKGYFYATVNGRYEYYNMTGTAKSMDRDGAVNAALNACRQGMSDALRRYTPSQEFISCRHQYCL